MLKATFDPGNILPVVVSSCLRNTRFMFSRETESRGEEATNFSTLRAGRGLRRDQVGRVGVENEGAWLTRLGWLQMLRNWRITLDTEDRSPLFNKS